MPSAKPAYRTGPLLREVIDMTAPEYLVIREISPDAFVVATPPSPSGTEYIAARARFPDQAREFASINAAVRYAVELSNLSLVRFELIKSDQPRETDG